MKEQKLYHWASYLLPGLIFLFAIGASAILIYNFYSEPNIDINSINNNSFYIAFSVIVIGFVSYLLGMLLWGMAYNKEQRSLWYPFGPYQSNKKENGIKPQYVERIETYNKTIKQLKYEEDEVNNVEDELKIDWHGYRKFQKNMFLATETLCAYAGPRIISQWESLGLLLTLSLTFRLIFLFCFLASLHFIHISIYMHLAFLFPSLLFIIFSIMSVTGYQYRNINLGRDVAYADYILAEDSDKLSKKGEHEQT